MVRSTGGLTIIKESPPMTVNGTRIVNPSRKALKCLSPENFAATGTILFSMTV
ncbi:hypothetical protein SG0102_22940 [Intestinibaculum porci]|uniref:Uncharacterized protein n=1 Tax=Intestinibaculum porci TaxID=2487118 RepID=A0A3G9J8I6_9FIRM|nr:hypothetical protein SG0102_22940 [Intestinibaculum porci]